MRYSIVYGTAFADSTTICPDELGRIRVYVVDDEQFIGHDSTDIDHACCLSCVRDILSNWRDVGNDAYASPEPREIGANLLTADLGEFDPGDDEYVTCAGCGDKIS